MTGFLACTPTKEPVNYFTTSDGQQLYFESYGTGNSALLFIHGHATNLNSWDKQIDYFREKYRVILVDLPGYGKSGTTRDEWTMRRYGTDLSELIYELQLENVHVIGWSLGSVVAMETAKQAKDKVQSVFFVDLLKVVEMNLDSTFIANFNASVARRYKNFDEAVKSFMDDTVVERRNYVTEKWMSMMAEEDTMPTRWAESAADLFTWMSNEFIPTLEELNIPIRAINSDKGRANMEQWNKYYDDFEETRLTYSNHMLILQYPDKFNQTLDELLDELSE